MLCGKTLEHFERKMTTKTSDVWENIGSFLKNKTHKNKCCVGIILCVCCVPWVEGLPPHGTQPNKDIYILQALFVNFTNGKIAEKWVRVYEPPTGIKTMLAKKAMKAMKPKAMKTKAIKAMKTKAIKKAKKAKKAKT